MTVQKKILDLTGSQYLVQKVKSAINDVDSSLSTHIADTDIHVTSADKTTWNTVTSKANDSDVVHKSGDETIAGIKTFSDNTYIKSLNFTSEVASQSSSGGSTLPLIATVTYTGQTESKSARINLRISANGTKTFYPHENNQYALGTASKKWSEVRAYRYYYGYGDIEFSDKFVTTDTAQTISGDKTWSGSNAFKQNITYERTNFYHQVANPSYILKDTELEKGSLATTHASYPGLWHDKNSNILGYVRFVEYSSGRQTAEIRVSNLIKNGALDPTGAEVNCGVQLELQPAGEKSLIPETNNDINLGTSTNKWKSINGLEPSSLSLPSGNANDVIDISSYFDNTVSTNSYTASANGWIYLKLGDLSGCLATVVDANNNKLWGQSATGRVEQITIPILKGQTLITEWATGSTVIVATARFIPCQGNV